VSEFLLDTSWDPDDTDEASALFDEPQFEPMYRMQLNSSTILLWRMTYDERHSFS